MRDAMVQPATTEQIVAFARARGIEPKEARDLLEKLRARQIAQRHGDPYNFGYALRSLYAAGVDGIILDERNWMTAAGVVARSSAGASELFPLFTAKPTEAADCFKSRGFTIVCADLDTPHTLEETEIRFPVFLVGGGERRGISRALLDRADLKVKISYGRDFRASLSAASAATILAYEIFRQNKK